MKKIFTICTAALLFAACSNKDLETKKDVVVIDTTGMYKNNASTDVAKNEEVVAPPQAQVKTITKVIYVDRTPRAVKQQTVREATQVQTQPVTTVPVVTNTGTANTDTKTNTGETSAGTTTSTGNNDINTAPTSNPVEKKKGWNNAAKDATIGGVGGAVVGAVIGKNKVKGAIIGGILGGVGGYILGNKKDKKDQAQYADQ